MNPRWAGAARGNARVASPVLSVSGVYLVAVFGMAGAAGAADRPATGSARKQAPSVPQVALIDRAIAEAWNKAGVKPARPATDEEFLRRAYLDLVGRIPNVQEARAFLATRERDKRE